MELQKPIINILTYILDDDFDYITLVDKIFKDNKQIDYFTYTDINEFLSAIDNEKKICIIDYNYKNSDLTGLDVMRMVLTKNPSCYIIMVSSQQDINVVTEFYDNSGFRYINKMSEHLAEKLISTVKQAKETVQRHLDYHFELIEKFNKTAETFKDARNTLSNNYMGNS